MQKENSKLQSLHRILEHEQEGGFQDAAVVGGLDLFLRRWECELGPLLGGLASYSVLTPSQRESWAVDVLAKLGSGTSGKAREVAAPTARPPSWPKTRRKPSGPVSLDDSIYSLKGYTPKVLSRAKLKRLGMETVGDLLYLIPNRHDDFANIRKVSELVPGEEQTVVVTVWEAAVSRVRPRLWSIHAVLGDDSGNVRATWFRNSYKKPFLADTFRTGTHLVISGKVKVSRGTFVFESPEYELLQGQEELVHTGRLVPVYPTVDGLTQRTLRRVVKRALDAGLPQVADQLPESIRHRTGLMGLRTAIAQAHYPESAADWAAARHRLAFDELLLLQLAVLSRKRVWQDEEKGIPLHDEPALLQAFLASLPFKLTGAQNRVLNEVLGEMNQSRPMSRLLQGDVGSGKTVVAAAAMLVAAFNGYQAALMAPTEILAEQHFLTISNLLSGVSEVGPEDNLVSVRLGRSPMPVTIGLLLGSLPKKAKDEMHRRIAEGEVELVIGTHALIQADVDLSKLALAVVDEQHRFGVIQRASIRGKWKRPHLLAMSATPIPRSLALTLYGDLDISVIDAMPPGRQRIRTRWVEPAGRMAAYGFVEKEVKEGRQAFIVCPLIEESEAVQTRAATKEHDRLSRDVYPDRRLGLLHGRMALREKEQVMELFQRGELDILVSTPVVEVGIDVPNATVMLIDGADRFGLSQLHQFRGRVGRGDHQGYCLLLADSPGGEARERLKLVERIQDGFELAEEDLRLRGPGDYMGTRQSGIPNLRVARITDHDILTLARQEANRILDADPALAKDENALLAAQVQTLSASLAGEMS